MRPPGGRVGRGPGRKRPGPDWVQVVRTDQGERLQSAQDRHISTLPAPPRPLYTRPMSRTILVFGDSNTYGTPPMRDRSYHPRLPRRWPVVLREITGAEVIEEGLGGRTACAQPAGSVEPHLDGQLGLRIALMSHGPIDDLVIMLGSNDLQLRHGKGAEAIAAGLAGLLVMAHDPDMQARHGGFATTLIAPPHPVEAGTFARDFHRGPAKATALAGEIERLAALYGCGFLDAAAHVAVSPVDGIHFDAEAHDALGRAVADYLVA